MVNKIKGFTMIKISLYYSKKTSFTTINKSLHVKSNFTVLGRNKSLKDI